MDLQLYTCPCPTDCNVTMPAFKFADCVELAPEEKSEIIKVWLDTLTSNETTGEEEPADLPRGVVGAAVGWYEGAEELLVIGELSAPDSAGRPICGGRTKYGVRTYTIYIDKGEASKSLCEA